MARKNRRKGQGSSKKHEEPDKPTEAYRIKTSPEERQRLRERIADLAKDPKYDGRMRRLFTELHAMSVQAQANLDTALDVFMAFRHAARLDKLELEQVREHLAERKEETGGLNAMETQLNGSIRIVKHEEDLRDSIEALETAVSEFHLIIHPPSASMSKKEYANCLASLRRINATLVRPYPERQNLLSPFRDGKEWDLIAHHFYEYAMFAIDTAMGDLESALHNKVRSDADHEFWVKERQRWEDMFKASKKVLESEDMDLVGMGYRRKVYILLNAAKEEVVQSQAVKHCDTALELIFSDVNRVLNELKTHANHALTTKHSAASLAHIPVSRRSLLNY